MIARPLCVISTQVPEFMLSCTKKIPLFHWLRLVRVKRYQNHVILDCHIFLVIAWVCTRWRNLAFVYFYGMEDERVDDKCVPRDFKDCVYFTINGLIQHVQNRPSSR